MFHVNIKYNLVWQHSQDGSFFNGTNFQNKFFFFLLATDEQLLAASSSK